jgi:hypothetical protein
MKAWLAASLIFTGACAGATANSLRHDASVVLAFNERLLAIAKAEDGLLTLKGVRTAAMMHIAMHDALNLIDQRYQTYGSYEGSRGGRRANPVVAAAQAAYDVAVNQYPDHRQDFGALLAKFAGPKKTPGAAQDIGVAFGHRTAAATLAARADDGWNKSAEYHWQPMGPGVYAEFPEESGTPVGFVFGAGWAVVRPFGIERPDQFRVMPPPAINSKEYTRAFNEVKELGRFESPARTADQTHLAFWWKDFAENSHNRLARALVAREKPDLWATARLFALLNMSIIDGYIGSFDSKFFYNHWRPYTAIRWAANDGNPATRADPDWNNTHRHTYAFPSYPSAHGTVCAAAASVLEETFGKEFAFTMETREVDSAGPMSKPMAMDPPTRSFRSFSEAATECAMSRVYLGIHFRYDSVAGNELGSKVGQYILQNRLQAVHGS